MLRFYCMEGGESKPLPASGRGLGRGLTSQLMISSIPFERGEQELAQSWQDNLLNLLEELHHILNIPAILTQLNPESIANPTPQIHNLILIPHRDLHRFPLHALFPDTFTITYLPSAQIGLNLHNRGMES